MEFEKKKEVCILYGFNSKVYGRGFALKELTVQLIKTIQDGKEIRGQGD